VLFILFCNFSDRRRKYLLRFLFSYLRSGFSHCRIIRGVIATLDQAHQLSHQFSHLENERRSRLDDEVFRFDCHVFNCFEGASFIERRSSGLDHFSRHFLSRDHSMELLPLDSHHEYVEQEEKEESMGHHPWRGEIFFEWNCLFLPFCGCLCQ
ncbi:hypothetical protein PENTCL1PPCAC_6557, partial [Pristionchus entomophagus]